MSELSGLQARVMRLLHEEKRSVGDTARTTGLSVHRVQMEEAAAMRALVDILSKRARRGGKAQREDSEESESAAGPSEFAA